MRKLTIILTILISCVCTTHAKMDPLYTQFMTNPFLINPALAGTYNYYQIVANSRLQWVGLSDAPITNVLSMFGPTVKQPMGLGGYIMHDVWGLTSITTLNASYAYNYGITEDLKISMGLSLGLFQYKIEGSGSTEFPDPVYAGDGHTQFGPDATVGLYVYSSVYHGGIAMTNLLGNKINIGEEDSTITGLSRFKRHAYLHGGYKYMISREFSIEPTIILRKVGGTPLQVDFNVRAWYGQRQWENNKLWGGVSFRSQDAITIMVGFSYMRKIEIGYSYDIGITEMRAFNTGSHELYLGFKFNDIKEY